MNAGARKYALIDRDGTIVAEPTPTRQVDSVDKLAILDGAIAGLTLLRDAGFRLAMVSNQDGLGTPAFPRAAFEAPQARLLNALAASGIEFDAAFICPHFAADGCACRKPKTGLVKDFLSERRYDRAASLVCGDRDTDAEFAANLNLRFVKLQTNGDLRAALLEQLDGKTLKRSDL